MARSTAAHLPIRDVCNANLAWVRDQLGDLETLRNSIKTDGLQLPILLRKDHVVIDGARRLLASKLNGETFIPVHYGRTWSDVVAYFDAVKQLEAANPDLGYRLPLQVAELEYLVADLLESLYKSERDAWMERRAQQRIGKQPIEPMPTYNKVMAETIGMPYGELRLFRDVEAKFRKAKDAEAAGTVPAGTAAWVRSRIVETQRADSAMTACRNLLERVATGEVSWQEANKVPIRPRIEPNALTQAKRRGADGAWDNAGTGRPHTAAPSRPMTADVARGLQQMLTNLAAEVDNYDSVTGLAEAEAKAMFLSVQSSARRMAKFRALLKASTIPPTPTIPGEEVE